MTRRKYIVIMAIFFSAALIWCIAASIWPWLASATANELYGVACLCAGWAASSAFQPLIDAYRSRRKNP